MLILASASPRRRELLSRMGIDFRIQLVEVDETPLPGETPEHYAKRVAQKKAVASGHDHPNDWVLAADTVVALHDQIFGKPKDEAEARAMLAALAGQRHRVTTAYCIRSEDCEHIGMVTTEVNVVALSDAEIDAYLRSGEWRDKAGAYAIQGVFAYAVSSIRGSYTNVIGLPLTEVIRDLVELGALPEFPPDAFPG